MRNITNLPKEVLSMITGRFDPPSNATAPVSANAPYMARPLSVEEKARQAGRDLAKLKSFLARIGSKALFHRVEYAFSPEERRSYLAQTTTHLANRLVLGKPKILSDINNALIGQKDIGLDLSNINELARTVALEAFSTSLVDINSLSIKMSQGHDSKLHNNCLNTLQMALNKNTDISYVGIDFSGSNMSYGELSRLVSILQSNSANIDLNVSKNRRVLSEDVSALSAILDQICHLNLADCKAGSVGVKALANSLSTNASVKSVNISGNDIGDHGTAAIAKSVQKNSKSRLQNVDLGFNDAADDGAKAWAEAIKNNSNIEYLNLAMNEITDKGAEALSKALGFNQTIRQIDLRENQLSERMKELLGRDPRILVYGNAFSPG